MNTHMQQTCFMFSKRKCLIMRVCQSTYLQIVDK